MEDGNVTLILEFPLNFEASRGGNVLQIDAAKGAGDQRDGIHKLVHIVRFHAERKRVDIAERLEEHTFALHDRHTGLRADVAEAEHRAAVRNNRAEIAAPRQLVAPIHVLLDFKARLRHAGRIGKAQVVLCLDRHPRLNFDFPFPLAMQSQGFFCVVHMLLLVFPEKAPAPAGASACRKSLFAPLSVQLFKLIKLEKLLD